MHAITSDSLSKTYRSGIIRKQHVPALVGFSIEVDPGQIFGLLGPNGAGKTTFIKILLSITHPSSGEASILGTKLPSVHVRKRIGYLPENHRYPGYLTGEQLLKFFGRLSAVSSQVLQQRIPSLLQLVGMDQWRTMKVKKYSKGMLQRLGLAQSLINDPEVLFLDEPTDGVDPVGRKEIRDVLTNLKKQGKTIFLNSHLLSEVELISDRVAILDKGKLLKTGTVDELTATSSLYHIGITGAVPENLRHEASAMLMKLQVESDSMIAEMNSTGELNKLIDLLRKYQVEITSIVQKRSSLEDSFINLIKREIPS